MLPLGVDACRRGERMLLLARLAGRESAVPILALATLLDAISGIEPDGDAGWLECDGAVKLRRIGILAPGGFRLEMSLFLFEAIGNVVALGLLSPMARANFWTGTNSVAMRPLPDGLLGLCLLPFG